MCFQNYAWVGLLQTLATFIINSKRTKKILFFTRIFYKDLRETFQSDLCAKNILPLLKSRLVFYFTGIVSNGKIVKISLGNSKSSIGFFFGNAGHGAVHSSLMPSSIDYPVLFFYKLSLSYFVVLHVQLEATGSPFWEKWKHNQINYVLGF